MGLKELVEKLKKRPKYVEKGDPTPVAMPAGMSHQEPLDVRVRRILRSQEFENGMRTQGFDTYQEANDFADPEEEEMSGPYDVEFNEDLGRDAYRAESQELSKLKAQWDKQYESDRKKYFAEKRAAEKKKAAQPPKKED